MFFEALHHPTLLLSFAFFLAAFVFFEKTSPSKIRYSVFAALSLISAVIGILYFASDYFTGEGITDATLYHIKFGFEGAGVASYAGLAWFAAILFAFIVFELFRLQRKGFSANTGLSRYEVLAFFCLFFSISISPALYDLYHVLLAYDLKESGVLDSPKPPSNFDGFYVTPSVQQIGEKKNVVFIYTEGLERTFSDENVFPGLTPHLNELESQSVSFTNLHQPYRAGYTIAGMVASQCGLSLMSSRGNSKTGLDEYLPAATCLGDLLKEEGYHLSYYGGANLTFAGKGTFLKTHGFEELKGLQELLPKVASPNYKTSWGLYDDTLFDLMYQRFSELSSSEQPFGLFAITLDTHQSDPHPSKSCEAIKYGNGDNPMLNAVACSDYLISEFVSKIRNSPAGKNTVIVIASDHLSLRNTAMDKLETEDRTDRLMILSPEASPSKNRMFGTTLDTGATVLPFLGFETKIGLGRNLLDPSQPESERYAIQENLPNWESEMRTFWGYPKLQSLAVDVANPSITIGDRKFRIPILIELDKDFNTNMIFRRDFFDLPNTLTYIPLMERRIESDSFVLIDECTEIPKAQTQGLRSAFCLAAGKDDNYAVLPLTENKNFAQTDIEQLVHQ